MKTSRSIRSAALFTALCVIACAEYRVTLDGGTVLDGGTEDASVAGDGGTPDGGAGDGGAADANGFPMIDLDAGFPYGTCADLGREVTLSPLDLMVLLDVSGSMDYDLKWVAVKSAMTSFVTQPQFNGLGVGVEYFPQRILCKEDIYATPEIPIGLLPGNSSGILTSLDGQRMSGGTPTATALAGAVTYLQAHLATPQAAGRKAVIVLATDGVPDETCGGVGSAARQNTIDNVVEVAAGAALSSPPIQTFVIGVGKELTSLDMVADAGGTDTAVLVDVAGNADVQFLAALTQIRKQALGCDFEITDAMLNGDTGARVLFIPNDGTAPLLPPNVTDLAACDPMKQGWYWEDPATMKKVVLCPKTCDTITSGITGSLKVEIACRIN